MFRLCGLSKTKILSAPFPRCIQIASFRVSAFNFSDSAIENSPNSKSQKFPDHPSYLPKRRRKKFSYANLPEGLIKFKQAVDSFQRNVAMEYFDQLSDLSGLVLSDFNFVLDSVHQVARQKTRNAKLAMSIKIFEKLKSVHTPNEHSYKLMIDFYANSGMSNEIKILTEEAKVNKVELNNIFLLRQMIKSSMVARDIPSAIRAFTELRLELPKSEEPYVELMRGYAYNSEEDLVKELFNELTKTSELENFSLTARSYGPYMYSSINKRDYDKVEALMNEMIAKNITLDSSIYYYVISALVSKESYTEAALILQEISQKKIDMSPQLLSLAIQVAANFKYRYDRVLGLLDKMKRKSVSGESFFYYFAPALMRSYDSKTHADLFEKLSKYTPVQNQVELSVVLLGLVKSFAIRGEREPLETAISLVEKIEKRIPDKLLIFVIFGPLNLRKVKSLSENNVEQEEILIMGKRSLEYFDRFIGKFSSEIIAGDFAGQLFLTLLRFELYNLAASFLN
ncbi:hypothetical protein HK096_002858, partial [Nowakowskiella sp. JEL0078]